jgi:membrane dipeptidase
MSEVTERLHREAIVIDATCPLASFGNYFEKWIAGGATVIAPTLSFPPELMPETMTRMGEWLRRLRLHQDKILQVTSIDDIYRAKKENRMGILFHFQGTTPFERDLNNIEIYYRLGVRMVQLCYNVRDFVGDGCAERTDCGLSQFGVKVIEAFNRLGIVVDCAHTGYRTTMDAIEVSQTPVIVSHGNARTVCDSYRNLTDDLIKAIAKNGGVIGINGYPAFVAKKSRPTLDDLIDHVDHIAGVAGVEHISLGIDYFQGQAGVADDEQAKAAYAKRLGDGAWDPRAYPPPPWYFPEGIEMPDQLPNLTAGLIRRGYSEEDVKGILGLNLLRVFEKVWQ